MPDMLVHLLTLPDETGLLERLKADGVQIRRALAPDKFLVVDWVREHSSPSAAGECDVCFAHTPVSCFVATRGADIVGYACYDAMAPDFFGPTRVLDSMQGKGIGKGIGTALLIRSLRALQDEGYVYAIIGGVGPQEFYGKTVGAVLIPDSTPGIYADFLGGLRKRMG
ncbi:MAG TPA: GNAT family N-acetyltransferase [Clostridia bacterium]|nr:GNAT family N-acetyltransferase [Clostridia bacterium]